MPSKQSQRWGVTLWTDEYAAFDGEVLHYMKAVQHKCPDTDKLHWHLFLHFKTRRTMASVKTFLGDQTAHLKPLQNNDTNYLDDGHDTVNGPFEFGSKTSQGSRTDLKEIATMVKSGKRKLDIAEEHPEVIFRYSRGLDQMYHLYDESPRWRALHVQVIWGPTGVGKTRSCYDSDPDLYCVEGNGRWWNGYDKHSTILLDEFNWQEWKITFLLRVLDGYRIQVETKGGFVYGHWTKVYITSNIDPDKWFIDSFNCADAQRPALFRRISEITYMDHYIPPQLPQPDSPIIVLDE